MIGLLQRVHSARVEVGAPGKTEVAGAIDRGLLVLVGVERGDEVAQARRLAERLLAYRVFPDVQGRMNLDVRQAGGGVLLVSQFTLAADTSKGNRPGFHTAAPPAEAEALFNELVARVQAEVGEVQCGRFGADMDVHLVNDGPVTISLRVPPTGVSSEN